MATKHVFSKAERFGVFRAHDGHCFWCEEPLEYRDCTIDHVIPESVLNSPEELPELLGLYGLDSDFQINSFENWVPAHQKCNGIKSSSLLKPSRALIFHLERVSRKADEAKSIAEKAQSNRAVDKIIGALEVALEARTVPIERIRELLEATMPAVDSIYATASTGEKTLLIGGWEVYSSSGDIAYVSRDGRHGYTYVGSKTR